MNDIDKLCQKFNWTYDQHHQSIMTRDKKTNYIKIIPWPSLDAIFDAESKLSPQQFTKYTNILCDLTNTSNEHPNYPNVESLIHLPFDLKLMALTLTIN